MFAGLKKRWNVNGWRVLLILISFAVAGSATGYVAKLLMNILQVETAWIYIIIYVVAVTMLWPLMVIVVSFLFGQFNFFRSYLQRIGKRIFGMNSSSPLKKIHLALFASGTGTNAQKIIDHFRTHPFIQVSLLASNNPGSGALAIAAREGIPQLVIEKEKFFRANAYVDELKAHHIDLVVLAGFLWKLPPALISAWPKRIINIHPALLPKYGGKGLYGHHVHEAVINAREKESGITIHYVDEIYDHGEPILQEKVVVEPSDTPQTLAKKIQALEHAHFPGIIEKVAMELKTRVPR